MIKVLIIEDEPNVRALLKKMLTITFPNIKIIGETSSVKESISFIRNNEVDLALVDFELKDGSSFEIFDKLESINFKVIFITAFSKYAIKAYKINALDYLLKPIDPEELKTTVQNAINRIHNDHETLELLKLVKQKKDQKIKLKTVDRTHIVQISDIIRLEAEGAYTLFVTENGTIMVSKNLKYFESLLEEFDFVRIHQSHLINLKSIEKIKNSTVFLSNKQEVPFSTRKKKELLQKVGKKYL